MNLAINAEKQVLMRSVLDKKYERYCVRGLFM